MQDRRSKKDEEKKPSSFVNGCTSIIFGGVIGGGLYKLLNKDNSPKESKDAKEASNKSSKKP